MDGSHGRKQNWDCRKTVAFALFGWQEIGAGSAGLFGRGRLGSPGRIRTAGQAINSRLLYR